jgi:hypothetical protein
MIRVLECNQPNFEITATITSCGRSDLLERTINSLLNTAEMKMNIKIYDDSANSDQQNRMAKLYEGRFDLYLSDERMGQAFALDYLYSKVKTPWLFHCEDDWEFIDSGYFSSSMKILTEDPSIIIVGLALRSEYFGVGAATNFHEVAGVPVYDHPRWRIDENHGWWNGWVGSPNLKRTKDTIRFGKFSSVLNEEEWDRKVFSNNGVRSVWLTKPCVRHIGDGRTLFVSGDMIQRNWLVPGKNNI